MTKVQPVVNKGQMSRRWLQGFRVEFWLPLPLLAAVFWLGCSLVTDQVLSRPYSTKDRLQANTQLEVHVSVNIAMIKATIDRSEQITQVKVQTTDSILKKLEFEFPVTDINQLETTIAQELKLPRQEVRRLVRYEIVN